MRESINIDSEFVCHCMRVTEEDLNNILREKKDASFSYLYDKHGIGGQCASCEFEVRGLLDDHRAEAGIREEISEERPRRVQHVRRGIRDRIKRFFLPPQPSLHGGLFALRSGPLESKVVVSNLNFPEGDFRPNGASIRFRITLFDEEGRRVARKSFTLLANHSREYALTEIHPGCPKEFVGAFDLEFYDLDMTGSLRPYAILEVNDPAATTTAARCHYHDKYATFIDPGFFQTAWPMHPGHECWVAVSNCQDISYRAQAVLQGSERTIKAPFALGPRASRWCLLADLFPEGELGDPADFEPGLFYLDNPQHVMVWFFWRHTTANVWIGNHH